MMTFYQGHGVFRLWFKPNTVMLILTCIRWYNLCCWKYLRFWEWLVLSVSLTCLHVCINQTSRRRCQPSSSTPSSPPTAPTTSSGPAPTGGSGGLNAHFVGKGKKFWGSAADQNTITISANNALLLSDFGAVTPEVSFITTLFLILTWYFMRE